MRLVPKDKDGRIRFFEARLAAWAERAAELGLTPEQVALLAEKVEAARAGMTEQRRLSQATRSATLTMDRAIAEMMKLGSGMISLVRATAPGPAGGAAVFAAAYIPPPGKWSRMGPPGAPYGFKTRLDAGGEVTLTWRCNHPRGARNITYQVYRRLAHAAPPEFLGAAGERRFVDATIPFGSHYLIYEVYAFRSTDAGPIGTHIVTFGAVPPTHTETTATATATTTTLPTPRVRAKRLQATARDAA